jgi:hypothetical protein
VLLKGEGRQVGSKREFAERRHVVLGTWCAERRTSHPRHDLELCRGEAETLKEGLPDIVRPRAPMVAARRHRKPLPLAQPHFGCNVTPERTV